MSHMRPQCCSAAKARAVFVFLQYPMAAGSAAERAEAGGKAAAKGRGREVCF